jgi:hypothetical protein
MMSSSAASSTPTFSEHDSSELNATERTTARIGLERQERKKQVNKWRNKFKGFKVVMARPFVRE